MIQACPCKRCKTVPRVVCINDLYYVQCCGSYKRIVNEKNLTKEEKETLPPKYITTKCNKWGPYEFLGASKRAAIESWNYANSRLIVDEED